jgi:LysR family transcriptional regulator, glycine cleavage system transcriptional activator
MEEVCVSEQSVPPLNWLRAFEASARLLSFTKAAQELNMSQSAVSQQMRSLESYLGQVLFLRGPRVLKLTEVGRNYLPVVQQALAGLSRGTRALSNKNKKKSLTIQCNLAFSMFWLAPRLQSFQHQNPWITVRILSELWPPMATEENADVEVRFGYRLEDKLGVQRLFNDTCFPAFGISFPGGDYDKTVNVVANSVWLEQMLGSEVDSPDEEDDFDEY